MSKKNEKIVDRILTEIQKSDRICIVGHVRPDGDCIGSQLGLAMALKNAGKSVTVWNEDEIPSKLKFLDVDGLTQKPEPGCQFDCVIAVDAASLDRLGNVGPCLENNRMLINIDHHPSNTRYGDVNWISPEPSTGELVYQLLNAAQWKITPPIADCLFTAVSTDTGSFQYPTTKPETYRVAGDLVQSGADLAKICDEVYQSYSLSRMRLLRHVFNRFRLKFDNQLAYFWLKKEDFRSTGANPADTEGLIDHIRSIDPVIVACVFEEIEPEITRISLRSKCCEVDVNAIAAEFGGGGHHAAAGARIVGKPLTIQRRVVASIRKALEKARNDR